MALSSQTILIWVILLLALLGVVLLTLLIYFGRRKVLCEVTNRPWCWTDWTCPDEPVGSKKRCPVMNAQEIAASCESTSDIPACTYAWETSSRVVEEVESPLTSIKFL